MSMLCMVCNKTPATVHVTRIVNNQITEGHYCANCASQKTQSGSISQNNSADILNSLMNLGGEMESAAPLKKVTIASKTCECCGLTYQRFKETGKLGCPECYSTFKDSLRDLLRRMHGSAQHQGKSPLRTVDLVERDNKVRELRQQLQKAIKHEDYEKAAHLRDLIKDTETN